MGEAVDYWREAVLGTHSMASSGRRVSVGYSKLMQYRALSLQRAKSRHAAPDHVSHAH